MPLRVEVANECEELNCKDEQTKSEEGSLENRIPVMKQTEDREKKQTKINGKIKEIPGYGSRNPAFVVYKQGRRDLDSGTMEIARPTHGCFTRHYYMIAMVEIVYAGSRR